MRSRLSFKYNIQKNMQTADVKITSDTLKESQDLLRSFAEALVANVGSELKVVDPVIFQVNPKNNKFVGTLQIQVKNLDQFNRYKTYYYRWLSVIKNPTPSPCTPPAENYIVADLVTGSVVAHENGLDYKVLAHKGEYTMLRCLEKNALGNSEIVVAWKIRKNPKNNKIAWAKSNFYLHSAIATEFFIKKVTLETSK